MGKVMQNWKRPFREVMETPFPKVFKICMDIALRDVV